VPDPTDGQSWNRYAYVDNDPLNWIDPSGHSKLTDDFWRGARRVKNRVSQAWDGFKNWWNTQPCECVQRDPINPTLGTVAGYGIGGVLGPTGVAGASAIGALPSGPSITFSAIHYKGGMPFSLNPITHQPYPRGSTVGGWGETAYHPNLSMPDYSHGQLQVGQTYKYGEYDKFKVTSRSLNWNWGGMAKLSLAGGLLSGIGQAVGDYFSQPCLSGSDRVMNALKAFGWGTAATGGGLLLGGAALLLGAPGLVASGIGMAASTGLGMLPSLGVAPSWITPVSK
jgi:hypothetical protein